MAFTRSFSYPRTLEQGLKAAKTLGLKAGPLRATGRWRSLQPIDGWYRDFAGPFVVTRGAGPAFVRDDGVEVFMLDDTAAVSVTFLDED